MAALSGRKMSVLLVLGTYAKLTFLMISEHIFVYPVLAQLQFAFLFCTVAQTKTENWDPGALP